MYFYVIQMENAFELENEYKTLCNNVLSYIYMVKQY